MLLNTLSGSSPQSPLLRLALRSTLVAGLAVPAVGVALPAAAVLPGEQTPGVTQAVLPQATVEAVDGACAVRVTLRAGVGSREVAVTARTAAPTSPAGRDVVVSDGGRSSRPAGSYHDLALDLDGAAGGADGPRVEVTVTVDAAAERTELSLPACAPPASTVTAVPSATPTGTVSATPSATVPATPTATVSATPTATATVTPTPTPTAAPAAAPTVTGAAPDGGPAGPVPGAPDGQPAPGQPLPATGGSGVSGTVALGGAVALGGTAGLSPLAARALSGVTVATLPALAAPGPAPQAAPAAPLPQLAPEASALFPPGLVPSQDGAQDGVAFEALRASAPPEPDVVADLLPVGTALALAVLALRGLVRRRRA